MSNSHSNTYTIPGPVRAGEPIIEAETNPLAPALNNLYARPVRAFSQGWGSPDDVFAVDVLTVGGAPLASWICRYPRVGATENMRVYVRATAPSVNAGQIFFQVKDFVSHAVIGSVTIPTPAGSPKAWYKDVMIGLIPGASVTGFCEVTINVDGGNTGSDPITIHEVYGEWLSQASPIPAGVQNPLGAVDQMTYLGRLDPIQEGGFVGVDANELDSDHPISSDYLKRAALNLLNMEKGRMRSLWSWSGVLPFDCYWGSTGPENYTPLGMPPWPHRAVCPHLPRSGPDEDYGTTGRPWKLIIRACGVYPAGLPTPPGNPGGDFNALTVSVDLDDHRRVFLQALPLDDNRYYFIDLPANCLTGNALKQMQIYPSGQDKDQNAPWRTNSFIIGAYLFGY